MSSPTPVHIPELPIATAVNDDDLFIINQSNIDRQLRASFLRAIQWGAIPTVTTLNASDLVLINQGGTSAKVEARNFMMPSGTRMWFHQATVPAGWILDSFANDSLLAVGGGSIYTNPGTVAGTWQQTPVALTVDQIPNHHHWGQFGRTQSNSNARFIWGAQSPSESGNPRYGEEADLGIVGGAGDNPTHNAYGACNPHNHGSTWRPMALVGLIAVKI